MHREMIIWVLIMQARRLRFSYGRTASRSDAQYGDDPYFGCQPEPVERAAHLRQRPQSQRPSQRLIRGADEKIGGHATFLDGRKSYRSAESRCRPGRDSSPQCRNRVQIPETPCRIDRTVPSESKSSAAPQCDFRAES